MRYLPIAVLVLATCLVGCGGGGSASVTGKVTANGEKVTSGNINFSPSSGTGEMVTAVINADGTYTVSGATAGKNRVVFASASSTEPVTLQPGEVAKPPAYSGFSVKTQEVDLKAGQNTVDIELTGPPQ